MGILLLLTYWSLCINTSINRKIKLRAIIFNNKNETNQLISLGTELSKCSYITNNWTTQSILPFSSYRLRWKRSRLVNIFQLTVCIVLIVEIFPSGIKWNLLRFTNIGDACMSSRCCACLAWACGVFKS